MSAYIVDPERINKILSFLQQESKSIDGSHLIRPFTEYGKGYDLDDPEHFASIGNELFALNVESVRQRYPNDPPDQLPGFAGELIPFRCKRGMTTIFTAYKLLREYLYQSCEGDCMDRAMYRAAEEVSNRMAHRIARQAGGKGWVGE